MKGRPLGLAKKKKRKGNFDNQAIFFFWKIEIEGKKRPELSLRKKHGFTKWGKERWLRPQERALRREKKTNKPRRKGGRGGNRNREKAAGVSVCEKKRGGGDVLKKKKKRPAELGPWEEQAYRNGPLGEKKDGGVKTSDQGLGQNNNFWIGEKKKGGSEFGVEKEGEGGSKTGGDEVC